MGSQRQRGYPLSNKRIHYVFEYTLTKIATIMKTKNHTLRLADLKQMVYTHYQVTTTTQVKRLLKHPASYNLRTKDAWLRIANEAGLTITKTHAKDELSEWRERAVKQLASQGIGERQRCGRANVISILNRCSTINEIDHHYHYILGKFQKAA